MFHSSSSRRLIIIFAILLVVGLASAILIFQPSNSSKDQNLVSETNKPSTDCEALMKKPGPWQQDVSITTLSKDGLEILGKSKLFVEKAGVPTMIEDADGRLIAAYQWFPCDNEEAFDRVAISVSENQGNTWSEPRLISVEGLPEHYVRPFDPTLILGPDKKIHLFFTSSASGSPIISPEFDIFSAVSDDGINYTLEDGARFDLDEPVFDSSVAYWNNLWHLITPLNINNESAGAYHATSTDGINFTRQNDIDNYKDTGWVGNFVVLDDTLRFYGVGNRTSGLGWTQTDDGETWSIPEHFTNFFGADPAVVCLEDFCLMLSSGSSNK